MAGVGGGGGGGWGLCCRVANEKETILNYHVLDSNHLLDCRSIYVSRRNLLLITEVPI